MLNTDYTILAKMLHKRPTLVFDKLARDAQTYAIQTNLFLSIPTSRIMETVG